MRYTNARPLHRRCAAAGQRGGGAEPELNGGETGPTVLHNVFAPFLAPGIGRLPCVESGRCATRHAACFTSASFSDMVVGSVTFAPGRRRTGPKPVEHPASPAVTRSNVRSRSMAKILGRLAIA
jgi:hypothetical protein